ncbi:unnamed protein product [Wuchereria bancrofti]|uniref:Uncharacterized protein n=1 Tax=Wuchereria bancrofti TaxID=6293 RepID=A0A3P7GEQ9_WUCBA|nr:unnamed protein product [Wuchereria bancrofti]
MLGVRKNRKKNASGRNQRWARTITVLFSGKQRTSPGPIYVNPFTLVDERPFNFCLDL